MKGGEMLDLIKNTAFWTAAVLVAPLAVNLDPADFEDPRGVEAPGWGEEATTTITVGGGAGTHGTGVELLLGTISEGGYDCEPATTREIKTTLDFEEDFIDVGAAIDHNPAGKPLHLGIRGGYVWEQAMFVGEEPINPLTGEVVQVPSGIELASQYGYANPYIAFEGDAIGIGMGVVISGQPLRTDDVREYPLDEGQTVQPSFHLRLGRLQQFYVNYSLWENVPIYSGGGAHNLGLGLQLGKHVGVWGGLSSGGPYQTNAALFRATLGSSHPVAVNFTTRVPMEYLDQDHLSMVEESSISMNLRFRIGGNE